VEVNNKKKAAENIFTRRHFGAFLTKNVTAGGRQCILDCFFVNKKNSLRGTMKNSSIPGEYERFDRGGIAFILVFFEMIMRGWQRSFPPV